MKSARLMEYGGELVFSDVPTPTISPDEILVKVRSTAVNHLDLVEASGAVRQIFPIDLPWTPGLEFSGIVEQIGSDVAVCATGDAVFGTTSGMGAYAEYLAVKTAAIGLAVFFPAYFGAEPWTGSNIETLRGWMFAEAARPSPP